MEDIRIRFCKQTIRGLIKGPDCYFTDVFPLLPVDDIERFGMYSTNSVV